MKRHSSEPRRRRGRPQKFGRPGELVQVTLPTDVVRGLRKIDYDLGRAIVQLFEKAPPWALESTVDAELASIEARHCLIVVNSSLIRSLPGVDIIPLEGNRAFLALAPGRGVSDLELAVIDRLGDAADVIEVRERQALEQFRRQVRAWREDPVLRFHSRAIVVVEMATATRAKGTGHQAANGELDVELVPFAERRSLIVVNSTVIPHLPGVEIIPLGRTRAFLALAPGRLLSDFELGVIDRMGVVTEDRERQALEHLRRQLRAWRQDPTLQFHARAIIVVESLVSTRSDGNVGSTKAEGGRQDTQWHAVVASGQLAKSSILDRTGLRTAKRAASTGRLPSHVVAELRNSDRSTMRVP